jgi:hypothetical protein
MSEDALLATVYASLFAMCAAYCCGVMYARGVDPKRVEDAHKLRLQAQNDLAEAKRERAEAEAILKSAIEHASATKQLIERRGQS